MTLHIRPLEDTDVEALVALWRACELTRPHNDPYRDIALARGRANSEILIGEQDGELTGSVMVGHDGHRGWVYYLAARPDIRGQGIGKQMMHAAEAFVHARGVRKLELMVRDTNMGVREFYGKIGYATEPVTVMSRWLAE